MQRLGRDRMWTLRVSLIHVMRLEQETLGAKARSARTIVRMRALRSQHRATSGKPLAVELPMGKCVTCDPLAAVTTHSLAPSYASCRMGTFVCQGPVQARVTFSQRISHATLGLGTWQREAERNGFDLDSNVV